MLLALDLPAEVQSSGATMRTFTGSVSQDASGPMHMAGTFNVLNAAFGNYGEYPFSANK